MEASAAGLADFQCLNDKTFLFQPSIETNMHNKLAAEQPSVQGPAMVVLCTWLGGATVPRITKYTTRYRQLFPRAQILLICTTILDITLRSFAQLRAALQPARNAIRAVVTIPGDSILLHVFSHGGCNTAIQLAKSMRDAHIEFPLQALVLDCCPGDGSFKRAYKAMEISLPPTGVVRHIGQLAIFPVVASVTGLQSLGMIKSVEDLREELNDQTVFGLQARRLYLYSKADAMVSPSDVESHERQAAARGFDTRIVAFQISAHCALILEDASRYWGAIKDVWEKGAVLRKPFLSKL